MTHKNALAKLLRALASAIESLDEKELEQLVSGRGKLVYAPPAKPPQEQAEPIDYQAIMQQVNGCEDRDQARAVLASVVGRDALANLAKAYKLHVAKHDRREDIESKIIEFVIGARLRTQAIQSLNLKGGGDEAG